MIYLLLLPFSLLILNIWLWLFDNVFVFGENKKKILFTTIIIGLLSGLCMIFYPWILTHLNLDQFNFTLLTNKYTINTFLLFIIYLFFTSIIFRIITGNFSFNKFYIKNILIFLILFLLVGFLGIKIISESIMIYYIFVAFGEEFLKYIAGINFWEKYKLMDNDIIVFSILSALGFAFVENIVYMINGVQGAIGQSFLNGLMVGGGMLFTRGVLGFLVHIIFTGNIGALQYSGLKKHKTLVFITLSIIIGISLHYVYDISLQYDHKIIIFIFVLLGYFFISYLFFKSDRIYLREGMQS